MSCSLIPLMVAPLYLPGVPVPALMAVTVVWALRAAVMSISVVGEALLIRNFLTTRTIRIRDVEEVNWSPLNKTGFFCKLQLQVSGAYIEASGVSAMRSLGFEDLVSPLARRRWRLITEFFRSVNMDAQLPPTCCEAAGIIVPKQRKL